MRKSSIATSVAIAATVVTTVLAGAPRVALGVLPPAFVGADSRDSLSYPYAHAGETLWLGMPVMPMTLRVPIRITGVRVHGEVGGVKLAFFDMLLGGPNGGRHVDGLTDGTFRRAGFHLGKSLIGTVFRPGTPTHYGIVRMTLPGPGSYEIDSITLTYMSSSGASGSQLIADLFKTSTCDPHCPAGAG